MDPMQISDVDQALLCARLHLRSGRQRLQKGLATAGIAALYDSVLYGIRYYIVRHEGCAAWIENIDLWDSASLFHALTRAGVFDDPLIFNRFSLLVERALWRPSASFDAELVLAEAEKMLMRLGVTPFH